MKVKIELNDITSFTREEVVERIKHLLGDTAEVSVYPATNKNIDILRFALQQLISYDQLCILNDEPYQYKAKVQILKKELLAKVSDELDSVIQANEDKYNE